jgi:hypothetical protein
VGEISVVDEPANEKEIIVAKSKEPEMTTEAAAAAQTPAIEATDTAKAAALAAAAAAEVALAPAEVVQIDLEEGTPDEVVKALQALVGNVATVAAAKAKVKVKPKPDDDDKKPAFLKAAEEKLKKAGLKGDQLKAALDMAKAAFGASGIAAEPTKKAAEVAPVPVAAPAVDQDELILKVLETISKAKSFTPARIKKLVETITNLNELLDDLGIDKAAFGATGITTTPTAATSQPPALDAAGTGGPGKPANPIAKNVGLTAEQIGEAVAKALAPVAEAQAELNGRLEALEKTRNPSTAPSEDGTEVPVNKGTGLWSNIIGG